MGRKRKKEGVPPMTDCEVGRGQIYVRVIWDDTSKGISHYVPLNSIMCTEKISGGSRVTMRHSGGKVWSGTVATDAREDAIRDLVQGRGMCITRNESIMQLNFHFSHSNAINKKHCYQFRVMQSKLIIRTSLCAS